MRYLRLWWRFVVMAFARETEYRVNFAVSVLEGLAQLGIAVVTLALIYAYTDTLAGWSMAEVLVLVGMYRMLDSILAMQIAPNLHRIGDYVSRGDMDFYLMRPVSSQFLVSLRWLHLPEAVNALIGLGITVAAAEWAGVEWRITGVVSAAVLAICGLVVLYSLWFFSVTFSFWFVRMDTFYLFYAVWETARYPVSIFKGLLRALLTFVVPVAFATTLPAQALLGNADVRLLPVGCALAALALLGSNRFWCYAVRHYTSASS